MSKLRYQANAKIAEESPGGQLNNSISAQFFMVTAGQMHLGTRHMHILRCQRSRKDRASSGMEEKPLQNESHENVAASGLFSIRRVRSIHSPHHSASCVCGLPPSVGPPPASKTDRAWQVRCPVWYFKRRKVQERKEFREIRRAVYIRKDWSPFLTTR